MTTPTVRLVAMCSVAIVIVSIITSTLWQDYPSWVWYLLAPVGVFAAGAIALISAAVLVRRRHLSARG